jgi:beta-xylosidase
LLVARVSPHLKAPTVVTTVALTLIAAGCATSAREARRRADERPDFPYVADQGDGTYRNPIIFADYSDPDVIRDGDAYYLISSSFTSTPALPILRSRDLVNWTIVGHAMENLPDARYAELQPGAGVWAPAIRAHAGTFFIFVPLPDEGIYVLTAPRPEGPWSAPRMLIAGRGLIDPCPFWDDDGQAYLVHAYARSRAGIKDRLRVRPMAPDASRLLGEGEIVFFDPARHPTLEGPKMYKRDGWYYILAPAGGVPHGWQVALRSRHVYGPYEDRVVLAQGHTTVNGPHQGALVDTPSGQWWFVHFQDAGVYGRVVHLNPVTWRDDWPLIGVAGRGGQEPVLHHAKPELPRQPMAVPQTSDEMGPTADGRLAPQWQWHANHGDGWFDLHARPGWLRLSARLLPPRGWATAPNLLLQKLPAPSFTADTVVELGSGTAALMAGVAVVGETSAALVVERDGSTAGARVVLRIDDRIVYTAPIANAPVHLRVTFTQSSCVFGYAAGGAPTQDLDARFTPRAGRWVGAQIGIFAATPAPATGSANAHADFDYFRFTPATGRRAPDSTAELAVTSDTAGRR